MRVERVEAVAKIDDDVVAADGVESNGYRAGRGTGNVFRDAVFNLGNDAVGDRERLLAIAAIALVVFRIARIAAAVRTYLEPVDGKALRNTRSSVKRQNGPSMEGCVGGTGAASVDTGRCESPILIAI